MFWKKNPSPPPIADTSAYTAWFIEHSTELKPFRDLYKDASTLVRNLTPIVVEELKNFPTSDALFERASEAAEHYHSQLLPFISSRGGLSNCSADVKNLATTVAAKIAVMCEFLVKKHHHPDAIGLFGSDNRQ